MDKLTVFVIVVLLAALRGLMQRRQVAKDLEQRLATARSRTRVRQPNSRLPSQESDDDDSEEGGHDSHDYASRGDE